MPAVRKLPPYSTTFLEKGRKREKLQKRKRRLSRLIKKASQSSRPQAQRSPIIFFGDMCGEENTSRPANVRAVRHGRTARALQSGRKSLCQKVILFDSLKRRLSRFRDRRLVFGMGSFGALGHAQRSELVAALVLPVHCQLAISGRSTPCAAMYCRCSTSLSRICCTV